MSRGRRLQITHKTGYRYADVVEASFNEVRMTPLDGGGQVLLSHHLYVTPGATPTVYTDYWGAFVESFDVHVPHRKLEIVASSTVDTPPMRFHSTGTTWTGLKREDVRDDFSEFLVPSAYVDDARMDESRAFVIDTMLGSDSPDTAVQVGVDAVRSRIAYKSGATTVSTTARQAWESGNGVCQDFSHALLSLLRACGIPARYVSGYLHTEEEAPGQTVVGESQAWVEYWDTDWRAIDPTNVRAVGSAHVVVARGRDYADVPPLMGIYAGGASEGLGVSVEITQI